MILEVHHPFLFLKRKKLRQNGILLKKGKKGNYTLIIPDDLIGFLKLTQGQRLYYLISNGNFIGYIYNYDIHLA